MDHSVNMTVETVKDLEHIIVGQSDILASELVHSDFSLHLWNVTHLSLSEPCFSDFHLLSFSLNVVACHCQYSQLN